MKLFIFVTYLWIMAFSQIINASNDNQEVLPTSESVTTVSTVAQEQFYCREDVSAEKSFEQQSFIVHEGTACDQAYNDRQTEVSEKRERHEYVIWSTVAPHEMILSSLD